MEMFFAIAIVTAVIGRGIGLTVSDAKYAAKGKDHPRWAYKQAKLEAARRGEPTGYWSLLAARAWRKTFDKHADAETRKSAKAPTEHGPRPLRDYMGRCWADAWKTQAIRHDKRVDARRRKRGDLPDQDTVPESVQAPTDAELTPATAGPEDDAFDEVFNSVPRDEPAAAVEHETTQAPADQSPVPSTTVYTESHDPVIDQIMDLNNQERRLRLQYARERARAYLYSEGPFDRKPSEEDLRVLGRGNEADRAMAAELRRPRPELDRQWDENVQRQDAEILRRAQAANPELWSPFRAPDDADAKPPERREPTIAEREELEDARHRSKVYFDSDDHTNLDRKPNSRDLGVLTAWGTTDQDHQWAERIQAEIVAELDEEQRRNGPLSETDDREEVPTNPAASDAATAEHPDRPQSGAIKADGEGAVPDNVIPFNQPTLPKPKGITAMDTTTDNEIDGLESAKAWAKQIKDNADAMAEGIDDVEAQFATWEITGESLAKVPEIGEIYEQLSGLAEELGNLLAAMDGVSEAYDAAPDAGSKEFVTN